MKERNFQLIKEREFGEVISDLIDFFKKNFKPLFGIYVRYGLSLMVVGFLLGLLARNSVGMLSNEISEALGGLSSLVFLFFAMLSSLLMSSALYGYVMGYEEFGKNEAQRGVSKYFYQNVFKLFVVGLAFFIISALFGLIVFLLISIGFIGGFLTLGLLIFLIYVMVKLMLAPYIYVSQDMGVYETFKQSWRLTEGKWWWTFGLYFVVSLMGSVLMYAVMIPVMLIMMVPQIIGGVSDIADFNTTMLITNFITYSFYMIYAIILFLLIPLMYYSLYDRMYGVSIESRIDYLDEKPTGESLFENEGEL